MKKVKTLDQRKIGLEDTPSAKEFEDLVNNTIFKPLTDEERARIDAQLPPSLRKGYKKKKDDQ
jgi:uncharacterized protein (DUF2267 family)